MKRCLFILILTFWAVNQAETVPQEKRELALTVYNVDLGLVKDIRSLTLKPGRNEVKFTDVAAKIDPTSVHFRSLTAPAKVAILEQNYEFDLVSSNKILSKYLDKSIKIFTRDGKVYEGLLLSFDDKNLVLAKEKIQGPLTIIQREENIQNIEFPALPAGLITKPTLVWQLEADQAGDHRCELSYLTNGINWHAEYVALVDKDDKRLKLDGWVSLDNRSGASYEEAKLKLIAGEVHRVKEVPPIKPVYRAEIEAEAAAVPFEEKPFFEYHMYTLKRTTTIRDNEIKQVSLFPRAEVDVNKIFTYDGAREEKRVKVNLEFKNSREAGLGIPLPEGKIRVYKEDVDRSLEFVGEDKIDHTPKDEKVRVYVGDAFDIVGERVIKDSRRIADRVREDTYEIKLRNHKDVKVEVIVIEHLYGDWEIIQTTHSYKKKDAWTIEFAIPVPKDGEVTIRYTVRFRW